MEPIISNKKSNTKIFFSKKIISFFYILIKIRIIHCNFCKENNAISNTDCFNNIIIFDDKKYRAGHHAINKDGDIIIEYSAQASRLFFGLKNNGLYYFGDNTPTQVIEI